MTFLDILLKLLNPTFKDTLYDIGNDERNYPYFEDYVGVIDGAHVKIIVPVEHQIISAKKEYTTTNVMTACDFNFCFTFVLAGW